MSITDPTDIYNWHRFDARLTTSGQPTDEQLAQIRALGVSHVVNLGLHDHENALPDEAASVAALGMSYTHIPVLFDAPTESDYARFAQTMAGFAGETVHVHCIANMRVSAFLYRWRREALGVGEDEARKAMDRIWKPGGVWAAFIGDEAAVELPYRFPGKDY